MTVIVPAPVAKGLDAIKLRGSCNMMDRATVIIEANELGFYETARWLTENEGVYQNALNHGYVSDGEDGEEDMDEPGGGEEVVTETSKATTDATGAVEGVEVVEREEISETGSNAAPVVAEAKPVEAPPESAPAVSKNDTKSK